MINIVLSTEVVFDPPNMGELRQSPIKSLPVGSSKWLLQRQENQSELNLLISFHDYSPQMENAINTNAILVHFPQNEH